MRAPLLLDAAGVAAALTISVDEALRLIKSGDVRTVAVADQVRVPWDSLVAFVAGLPEAAPVAGSSSGSGPDLQRFLPRDPQPKERRVSMTELGRLVGLSFDSVSGLVRQGRIPHHTEDRAPNSKGGRGRVRNFVYFDAADIAAIVDGAYRPQIDWALRAAQIRRQEIPMPPEGNTRPPLPSLADTARSGGTP